MQTSGGAKPVAAVFRLYVYNPSPAIDALCVPYPQKQVIYLYSTSCF